MADSLLEVKDLKISFRTREGTARAVDGVGFEVQSGETLGIVGESGCGKTLIALSIMRLVPAPGCVYNGSILFNGLNVLDLDETAIRRIRGKEISMVFQEPMTSLNPVFTCGDQIQEVLRLHQKMDKGSAWRKVIELFNLVGIPSPEERAHQYPHQFSGGMRQRAMMAMALACRPSLLIADEPTTALDVTVQAQILELLKDLQNQLNMSIIIITHDLGVVAEIAERVIVLYAGRIVEESDVQTLFINPLHPYTTGLLKSIPRIEDSEGRLSTIQGAVPHSVHLPPGCAFHPRCPEVMPICRNRKPELREYKRGHKVRCWLSFTGTKSEKILSS